MILVLGGAGYIGSHVCKKLSELGYSTVVFDNLSSGHREFVRWSELVVGDITNMNQLRAVFANYKIEAVIHLAAKAYVGESFEVPDQYYLNNVIGSLNVLNVMREMDCSNIIFSSTCATYGELQYYPVDEKHLQIPINPYGRSKLMVEQILEDYASAYALKFVCLRYFNACGADADAEIGERHDPETHLIPLCFDAVTSRIPQLTVNGRDFDTPDGTAIRDYVHVSDLAEAHVLSLDYILGGGSSNSFNLGNGNGYSVLQVINSVAKITRSECPFSYGERRSGDPAKLVGDSSKITRTLGWNPKYKDLNDIVLTAWNWYEKSQNV